MSFLSPTQQCQSTEELEFNVPFQHKYGYIRDERSEVESYPYPVKEGHTHTHTTVLLPFFRDHLGEPVPEENFCAL